MKPSMLTGNTEGVLSRSEMKHIMAGNDDCSNTNCWMCSTGGFNCTYPGDPNDGELPEEEGTTCNWGICDQCCSYNTEPDVSG